MSALREGAVPVTRPARTYSRATRLQDIYLYQWSVILLIAGAVGAFAGVPALVSVIGFAFLVIAARRGEA